MGRRSSRQFNISLLFLPGLIHDPLPPLTRIHLLLLLPHYLTRLILLRRKAT